MSLDLPAYLARVGLTGALAPDLATLQALHLAHTAAIPFENLDIHRGLPIRLDLGSIQAKLVTDRRGGYCFEQNALLAAVLEQLGFRVTRLCGRVRLGRPADAPVPPRTHMVLIVDLDEGPPLADVGFGGATLLHPIPPVADVVHEQFGWGYALRREGDALVLRGRIPGWVDMYAFTLDPQHPIDYEVANHYTSTYPTSHFVRSLTVQRATPEVRHVLRDRTYEQLRPDSRTQRTVADDDELRALLADTFDIPLPPGTRLPAALS